MSDTTNWIFAVKIFQKFFHYAAEKDSAIAISSWLRVLRTVTATNAKSSCSSLTLLLVTWSRFQCETTCDKSQIWRSLGGFAVLFWIGDGRFVSFEKFFLPVVLY